MSYTPIPQEAEPLLRCRGSWVDLPLAPSATRQSVYPVAFGGDSQEGTVYLEPGHLMNKLLAHNRTGKAWRYFTTVTTYQPNTKVSYKNVERLPVESEEDFWNVQNSCKAAGLKPPTSFADIFQQVYPSSLIQPTIKAAFLHHVPAATQKAFRVGAIEGRVFHYDLNSAYRWAASEGLPDLKRVRRVLRLEDDWDIASVSMESPLPYRIATERVILTRQEVELYRPNITAYHYGWKFLRWWDIKSLFDLIQKHFPYCHKRIGRAFWGRWNTRQSVEMLTWGNGQLKISPLKNPFHNPIWAHYIVSRVTARCLAVPDVLHISHDSILTRESLPTGEAPGQWRCEHELKRLFIVRTNLWGDSGHIIKHSGITKERAATWKTVKI